MEKNKIQNRERICTGVHIRESEGEESRIIEGYAILFDTPSDPLWQDEDEEAREIIDPAAITQEVLDNSDIKMTMFHDRQLILARSKNGKGTLSYFVDAKGVSFSFEAPKTADGDKALELVKRGDIAGCSFMFSTHYWDSAYVQRSSKIVNGKCFTEFRVLAVTGIYDFTLAADPAYPSTSVEAREFIGSLKKPKDNKYRKQLTEMRTRANQKIII